MSSGHREARGRFGHILSLDDFQRAARGVLPRPIYGYVAGAAEDNLAFDDNRRAFAELALVPQVLRAVAARSQKVTLFGREYESPFGIAPMGIVALSAYRGDIVLARAAMAAGIPAVIAGTSLIRLEDVLAEAPQSWFQAYLPGDADRIRALIARVAAAGVQTLVLTLDTPVAGNRENNVRAGFSTPLRPSLRLAWDGLARPRWLLGTWMRTLLRHGMPHFENSAAERGAPILSATVTRDFAHRDRLGWDDFSRIREQWRGTLLVKGIVHPADAAEARRRGADGIVVSNHGGRQLDGAIATLRALPGVVAEGGALPVLLDSGVRRGTDVLKAFALGAKFVFLGRPFNFAAAVGGEAAVAHAIALLRDEIDRNMALQGVRSLSELGPQHLHDVRTPFFPRDR